MGLLICHVILLFTSCLAFGLRQVVQSYIFQSATEARKAKADQCSPQPLQKVSNLLALPAPGGEEASPTPIVEMAEEDLPRLRINFDLPSIWEIINDIQPMMPFNHDPRQEGTISIVELPDVD